jgi:hypothetical protein
MSNNNLGLYIGVGVGSLVLLGGGAYYLNSSGKRSNSVGEPYSHMPSEDENFIDAKPMFGTGGRGTRRRKRKLKNSSIKRRGK